MMQQLSFLSYELLHEAAAPASCWTSPTTSLQQEPVSTVGHALGIKETPAGCSAVEGLWSRASSLQDALQRHGTITSCDARHIPGCGVRCCHGQERKQRAGLEPALHDGASNADWGKPWVSAGVWTGE